ncbi:MAG: hypothetical protein AAGC74_14195 [Verrucomicrobiota bacterium]
MDFIEGLDERIIFGIVFLVIGALRWFMENASKGRRLEEEDQEPSSSLEDLYEEARREILERQNRNAPDPEIVGERLEDYRQPTPTPPPLPPVTPPPPPLAPATATSTWQAPTIRRQTLSKAEQEALERVQKASAHSPSQRQSTSPSRVRELLSSPSSARDAIILAEILGPPKGATR